MKVEVEMKETLTREEYCMTGGAEYRLGFGDRARRQRGAPPASGYPGVPLGTSRRATQRQRSYIDKYESAS